MTTIPTRVLLIIQYWQFSTTEKKIIKAEVFFLEQRKPNEDEQKAKVKFEYELGVLYWGMSHRDVMINFGFNQSFYSALYVICGLISVGITFVQWSYHRLVSGMRYPPNPFNNT